MASTNRIEITVSDELLAAIDKARQHEPRASFIKRACEQALTASAPAKPRGPARVEPLHVRPPLGAGPAPKAYIPPRPKKGQR